MKSCEFQAELDVLYVFGYSISGPRVFYFFMVLDNVVEIAKLLQELGGGFFSDSRRSGDIVRRIAHKRYDFREL